MSVVLELEPEVEEKLKERAAARGSEFNIYLETELKKLANAHSYEEIMAPVWKDFEDSEMTEEEFGEFVDDLREKTWQEKKGIK